jgi:hypothetical protein
MKLAIRMLLATVFVLILASPPSGHAQTKAQKTSSTGAAPSAKFGVNRLDGTRIAE